MTKRVTPIAIDVLGVVSAGGVSRRYGSPKALVEVRGVRVVDRVAAALRAALGHDDIVAIVNDEALAQQIQLPYRADEIKGIGALAGVHTALVWAAERHCRGALLLGCDMPLVEPALLRHILTLADTGDVVIPESPGPRGVEPLCAYYATACTTAIEAAVATGDRRMIGFHDAVRTVRVPLAQVQRFGDPVRIFLNLNTPTDKDTAERWLQDADESG